MFISILILNNNFTRNLWWKAFWNNFYHFTIFPQQKGQLYLHFLLQHRVLHKYLLSNFPSYNQNFFTKNQLQHVLLVHKVLKERNFSLVRFLGQFSMCTFHFQHCLIIATVTKLIYYLYWFFLTCHGVDGILFQKEIFNYIYCIKPILHLL